MQKINKGLYLGVIIGAEVAATLLALVIVGIGVAMAAISKGSWSNLNWGLVSVGIFLLIIAVALAVAAAVFAYILLYRAWQAIQDGTPRTTAGKAVGFLFIPFFNLYWMFVAYWGWAKDFNAYIGAKNVSIPRVSEGLFLAYPILVLCSAVPYVGSLAGIGTIVVFFIICSYMIDAVNGLVTAGAQTVPAVQ